MSELILYTNPQSRGRIAHWMMEELGESYETVWLDYGGSMAAEDYLAINPMGKVPALRHDGVLVTETAAICAYLADRFPARGLLPAASDNAALAAYFRWLFFAAGPVEQAVTAKSLGWEVTDEQKGTVGFGDYELTIRTLETALTPGPFICGGQFTAADVYVGSHIDWGILFGSIDKTPVFEAYLQRLHDRPAYQRANQINEDYMANSSA